jgi:hypothetical protein
MFQRLFIRVLSYSLIFVPTFCSQALAQGTAFLYQGQLQSSGSAASGTYNFQFSLYTNSTGSTAVAGPLTNSAVSVSNGLFTVTIDFGAAVWNGETNWLQIGVESNGAPSYTTLSPRQQITPVPYAIFATTAGNLSGTLQATQLEGTLPASAFAGYTNTVALTNGANLFNGTFNGAFSGSFKGSFNGAFAGNGGSVTNVNVTNLTGVLADNQLPANTAFVNSNQTFSGANAFTNWGNSFTGSFFGNGLVGWIVVSGTAVQAAIDHGYLLTNSLLTTVTLPASANPGDIVRVSGAGAGGWTIAQNPGQCIIGNFSGYLGSTWQPVNLAAANWKSLAMSSAGSVLLAASYGKGLYYSANFGSTWIVTNSSAYLWQNVACSADGSEMIAATYYGNIYTNAGYGWGMISGSPTYWSSLAASASGNNIIVAVGNGSSGGVYTTSNFGVTWVQDTTGIPSSANWAAVASSASGSTLAAAVYDGSLYTSVNSGSSWNVGSGAPVNSTGIALAMSADGTKMAAAVNGGGIWTSSNSGATWSQQTGAPTNNWTAIACSTDGRRLAAAASGGSIYVSGNEGVTWVQEPTSPVQNWSALAMSSSGSQLAGAGAVSGNIYTSQAAAETTTTTGTNGFLSGVQGSAVELQCISSNMFMPVSSAGLLWAF